MEHTVFRLVTAANYVFAVTSIAACVVLCFAVTIAACVVHLHGSCPKVPVTDVAQAMFH